jgi:hypothetical protein
MGGDERGEVSLRATKEGIPSKWKETERGTDKGISKGNKGGITPRSVT